VGTNGPANFLVDVRLNQLRAPVAVVGADEAGDVVQQAGGDDLLVAPFFFARFAL